MCSAWEDFSPKPLSGQTVSMDDTSRIIQPSNGDDAPRFVATFKLTSEMLERIRQGREGGKGRGGESREEGRGRGEERRGEKSREEKRERGRELKLQFVPADFP